MLSLLVLTVHRQCVGVPIVGRDDRDDRKQWSGVACSLDGAKLVAVVGGYNGAGGHIYMSSDAGPRHHSASPPHHPARACTLRTYIFAQQARHGKPAKQCIPGAL